MQRATNFTLAGPRHAPHAKTETPQGSASHRVPAKGRRGRPVALKGQLCGQAAEVGGTGARLVHKEQGPAPGRVRGRAGAPEGPHYLRQTTFRGEGAPR